MKYYYDFHIHSALSPCGDNDMTPNNIVNMSVIKELDIIALTDHNSTENIRACMEVCRESELDLLIIPGMEVETQEEIHVVCLFPTIEKAEEMGAYIAANMPRIKNRKDIYGDQFVMDSDDEITGELDNLLLVATNIDLYSLVEKMSDIGGIAIPAHVDRSSYSIISQLGYIPEDLDIGLVEVSRNITDTDDYKFRSSDKRLRKMNFLRSSDAHYLSDINEKICYIELDDDMELTPQNIINALKKLHHKI